MHHAPGDQASHARAAMAQQRDVQQRRSVVSIACLPPISLLDRSQAGLPAVGRAGPPGWGRQAGTAVGRPNPSVTALERIETSGLVPVVRIEAPRCARACPNARRRRAPVHRDHLPLGRRRGGHPGCPRRGPRSVGRGGHCALADPAGAGPGRRGDVHREPGPAGRGGSSLSGSRCPGPARYLDPHRADPGDGPGPDGGEALSGGVGGWPSLSAGARRPVPDRPVRTDRRDR